MDCYGASMAMVARGGDQLEEARQMLVRAKTIEHLRQAQSVVLSLDWWGIRVNAVSDAKG